MPTEMFAIWWQTRCLFWLQSCLSGFAADIGIPLYSDAGCGPLRRAFSEVIFIAELVSLFLRHVARSINSRGYCWCGPWLVYGWWHIKWRGTETWIRWICSRTCYLSVHTSWAAVHKKRTSVMKKLMNVQEFLVVSKLQAQLFMTDHRS